MYYPKLARTVHLHLSQQDIYFDHVADPHTPQYNIGTYVVIKGNLDAGLFKAAIASAEQVFDVFDFKGFSEEAPAVILKGKASGIEITELDHVGKNWPEKRMRQWLRERGNTPFDIHGGRLYDFVLIKKKRSEHWFYVGCHHLFSDGYGVPYVLLSYIFDKYHALRTGEKKEFSFPSYMELIDKSAGYLGSPGHEADKKYWKERFSEFQEPVLPQNARSASFQTDSVQLLFSKREQEMLRNFCKTQEISLQDLLIAALTVYYKKTNAINYFDLCLPVHNRNDRKERQTLGVFSKRIPCRIKAEDQVLGELFKEIKASQRQDYRHKQLPVSHFNSLFPEEARNPSRPFDICVNYRYFRLNTAETELDLKGFRNDGTFSRIPIEYSWCDFAEKGNDDLFLEITYREDCFTKEEIALLGKRIVFILDQFHAAVGHPISTIEILPADEKHQLLESFNATEVAYPKNKTVVDLFEEQVKKTPEQTAVVCEETRLSYKALHEQSNQLAHYLAENYALKADELVGIKQERSEWMIISVLAVLKAGGAYVPIDPAYPQERIAYMEKDAKVKVCLDATELTRFKKEQKKYSKTKLKSSPKPQQLSHIIYTSGSTGLPKGVMIEHKSTYAFIQWSQDEFANSEFDTVLFTTSLNFDLSVFEIFHPLTRGREVKVLKDGLDIAAHLDKKKKLLVNTVPSVVGALLQQHMDFECISVLNMAGEPIPSKIRAELKGKVKEIRNLYGPSEDTTYSTFIRMDKDARDLIGKPISNTRIYILSESGTLQPIGLSGEICISGDGLARGYMNQEQLTKEKFVADPFKAGGRMYRTGDLGRWLPDGNIEFFGRKDHQVKIRGYRIEAGEIEQALLKHTYIHEAVVQAKENAQGEKELVAYITAASVQNTEELRTYLRGTLPEYMLPAYFVQLAEIPRTTNGKVDKSALPDPLNLGLKSGIAYEAPKNTVEEKLAELWAEVLGKEKASVGIDEGFFTLGGHSIKLMVLKSKIENAFAVKLAATTLFKYPTIRQQAGMLLKEGIASDDPGRTLNDLLSVYRTAGAREDHRDIAVIGMAIKAPGSGNMHEFWENLRSGKESIAHFTREELASAGIPVSLLNNPDYVKAGSYLEEKECFDPAFFGYLPDEAKVMDPQIRVFHEVVWSALEDAGYDPLSYKGLIGLYAGSGSNAEWETYSRLMNKGKVDEYTASQLSNKDFVTTLIAHKLNLNGPASYIDTACSTSLVAIHHAVRSLLSGEVHMAIAGGITLNNKSREEGYLYYEGMILSGDGHNRTFDKASNGTVPGEGAGAVILKRLPEALKDGDQVYAVIKGSAINNDGHRKVGFTAPSVDGQTEVIRMAQQVAGIKPESISYVEAHGTATKLGDPIEVLALTQAFGQSKNKYCALGAVKTNVGHLDSAAGVAGFIKTVLCLKHKELVPSLHFKSPNPEINFEASPFYVNTELKHWETGNAPRRAGVSSFGIGGTNAHVVLEEAPPLKENPQTRTPQIITLSGKTAEALERNKLRLKAFLTKNPKVNFSDLAWTYQCGRRAFNYRSAFVAKDVEEAIAILESKDKKALHTTGVKEGRKKVVFMFPGQGSQYENMGLELYEDKTSVFRKTMDLCFEIAATFTKANLKEILYPGEEKTTAIHETVHTQPILFMFEYALAKQVEQYGLCADSMIGHSVGEYVAACLSGVLSLDDALKLVIRRGELIQALPKGSMLSVAMPREELTGQKDSI